MSTERESLESQQRSLTESLQLIAERKAMFASPNDIPLQLLKDERALKQQLAEVERRLQALGAPSAAGGAAGGGGTQNITNTAPNQGAQGNFYGPVTINTGTPPPPPEGEGKK